MTMTPPKLEPHPAAMIFPLMEGGEFEQLVADIARQGQLVPIKVFQEKILDGRNRYRACERLNLDPQIEQWDGADPIAYVAAMNLHRRHLNDTQRAMIAARLANAPVGVHAADGIPSASQAAEMMKISRTSVVSARTIIKEGTPEEIAAAEAGNLSIDIVSREIRRGVPPEDRSKPKKRGMPRPGKLATAVYARIAAENDKKRRPAGRLRRRQTKPLVEPVAEPAIPDISFTAAIERLITARNEMTAEVAALELNSLAREAFSLVLLWMIDIDDQLASSKPNPDILDNGGRNGKPQ